MSNNDLLHSIEAIAVAAVNAGMFPRTFELLHAEVKRLIADAEQAERKANHYKLLYESAIAKYSAEEDLPPLSAEWGN